MTHLTTHVLDAVAGAPARDVAVVLTRVGGLAAGSGALPGSSGALPGSSGALPGSSGALAEGRTDADGRLALGPDTLDPGDYALTFDTGAYFAARGVETFYPFATITFRVTAAPHYHVPLLLSPFAYSTYRGS